MDDKKRPGRPRKLRPEETPGEVKAPVVKQVVPDVIATEMVVQSDNGKEQIAPVEGFDYRRLHTLTPWRADEPLPKPQTKLDRKGRLLLVKKGEPRFFFRGSHLIKTFKGFGVKTELYKRFKPQTKDLHKKIMRYLKEKVGIQERFG